MMKNEQLRIEEQQLRAQIALLLIEQKRQCYALELQYIKDPDTYAALNWLFLAGLHHFYIGKWQRGLINLTLMLIGVVLYFSHVLPLLGAALILVIFMTELPQLFNSQKIIYQYNNQLM